MGMILIPNKKVNDAQTCDIFQYQLNWILFRKGTTIFWPPIVYWVFYVDPIVFHFDTFLSTLQFWITAAEKLGRQDGSERRAWAEDARAAEVLCRLLGWLWQVDNVLPLAIGMALTLPVQCITQIVQGRHLWQVDERYDWAEGKSAGCLHQRLEELQPWPSEGSSEQVFWGGFSFPASAERVCWLHRRDICQGDFRVLCWPGGKLWLKACHSKVKIKQLKDEMIFILHIWIKYLPLV